MRKCCATSSDGPQGFQNVFAYEIVQAIGLGLYAPAQRHHRRLYAACLVVICLLIAAGLR